MIIAIQLVERLVAATGEMEDSGQISEEEEWIEAEVEIVAQAIIHQDQQIQILCSQHVTSLKRKATLQWIAQTSQYPNYWINFAY